MHQTQDHTANKGTGHLNSKQPHSEDISLKTRDKTFLHLTFFSILEKKLGILGAFLKN